jgi:hypothetical protein
MQGNRPTITCFQPEPPPAASALNTEQQLAQQSIGPIFWILAIGFLLANVSTNSFSLVSSFEDRLGGKLLRDILLGLLCFVFGVGTINANFNAKTIVLCDPYKALELDEELDRLRKRLERAIKLNKEVYKTRSTVLFLDSEVEYDRLVKNTKFRQLIQLIANRHGSVTIEYTSKELSFQQYLEAVDNTVGVVIALNEGSSLEHKWSMATLLGGMDKNFQPKIAFFNYDSRFESTEKVYYKFLEALKDVVLYLFVKGFPGITLFNQVFNPTINLLRRIPGFGTLPSGVQLAFIGSIAIWLAVSRVITNNVLKGDKVYHELNALWLKFVDSLCNRKQRADSDAKGEGLFSNCSLKNILKIGFGIVTILATVWYYGSTAAFYSPGQTLNTLEDEISKVAGGEFSFPFWVSALENIVSKIVIGSNVLLAALTSGKSTWDKLFISSSNKEGSLLRCGGMSTDEKVFLVSALLDSGTFAINAGFNSQQIVPNEELAWATAGSIFATNTFFSMDTVNLQNARAIKAKYSCASSQCCPDDKADSDYHLLEEGAHLPSPASAPIAKVPQ